MAEQYLFEENTVSGLGILKFRSIAFPFLSALQFPLMDLINSLSSLLRFLLGTLSENSNFLCTTFTANMHCATIDVNHSRIDPNISIL